MVKISRILVVEDEPEIAELIRAACQDDLGAVVECAPTGDAGIKALSERLPSLAVIGIVLPGTCGFDVAQYAINQRVPVILMTGHPDQIMTCERHGVPYLAKPFSIDDLIAAIGHAADNSEENIELMKRSLDRRAGKEPLPLEQALRTQ